MDTQKVQFGILYLISLILSVAVHEFGHAFVADRLGDRLPRSQGRVTLNPIAHADPIGTLLVPIIGIMTGGLAIAWGKPVQTNTNAYTRRFRRMTGHMFVSIAGPMMNLLMFLGVSFLLVVLAKFGVVDDRTFALVVHFVVRLNLLLMVFNMLPFPPLDGGTVLEWALPPSAQHVMDFLRRWGLIILIGLLFFAGEWLAAPVNAVTVGWVSFLLRVFGL